MHDANPAACDPIEVNRDQKESRILGPHSAWMILDAAFHPKLAFHGGRGWKFGNKKYMWNHHTLNPLVFFGYPQFTNCSFFGTPLRSSVYHAPVVTPVCPSESPASQSEECGIPAMVTTKHCSLPASTILGRWFQPFPPNVKLFLHHRCGWSWYHAPKKWLKPRVGEVSSGSCVCFPVFFWWVDAWFEYWWWAYWWWPVMHSCVTYPGNQQVVVHLLHHDLKQPS